MDFIFSQAMVVRFWILKEGKSSELDLQYTGESPMDPLLQRAAHM